MAQESWNRGTDGTGCQPPEGHILCANNCGFFGSSTTMNLCSKCYRDFIMKENQATSVKAAVEKSFVTGTASTSDASLFMPGCGEQISRGVSLDTATTPSSSMKFVGDSSPVQPPPPEAPNRCFSCRKRVGLTGFKCRCGQTFCGMHRYAEKHSCSFDFKAAGREAIAKANPVVKAAKIEKL